MEKTKLPISSIKPNPDNPRFIKDENFTKLVESIKSFPEMAEAREIVINTDHVILGGNMRFKAMIEAGWTEVPVKIVDWPEDKQREFVIKDNVSGGDWDWDSLANSWDRDELESWGLETSGWPEEDPEIEEDEAPEPPIEAKSKLGEVYQLGRHRVMCGDATKIEDVEKLMDGQTAAISFTSPPYNAGKNSHLNGRVSGFDNKYENHDDAMSDDDYLTLLLDSTNAAITVSDYAFINLQLLAHNRQVLMDYQYQLRHLLKDILIWNKRQCPPNIVKGAFNTKWEYVFCFSSDNTTRGFPTDWQGQYPNVIETESNSGNEYAEDHRAGFPVAFPAWVLDKLTFAQTVYDPFGGTGTTLIAAEQLGRTCYMMELDPRYIDVIRKRYHKLVTGSEEGWKDATPAI